MVYPNLAGAWGGDAARKQASIATARAALAAGPVVTCIPTPHLGDAGQPGDPSNVYCAAYGTADPAELEDRAGLPAATLMLASAVLSACEYWEKAGQDGPHLPKMAAGTGEAPIAVLEAIPVGADPIALARNYVVDLLGWLAAIRNRDGRGLDPEQQRIVGELAAMHGGGGTDAAGFRALRRTATAATDAAAGDLAPAVFRFVEAAAWPLAGLAAELPEVVSRLHSELRSQLAPKRPSPAEQATIEALSELYRALNARMTAEPGLDFKAELAKIEATPEFAAAYDPAFVARIRRYDVVAAEAYGPGAVDRVIGAFRRG